MILGRQQEKIFGSMNMFAGVVSAISNAKTHENMTISKDDAMRKLYFASMLMYKLDNSIAVHRPGSGGKQCR